MLYQLTDQGGMVLRLIIEDDCENKSQYEDQQDFRSNIEEIIRDYVKFDSLKYFVISNSDNLKFFNTINKYADLINAKRLGSTDEEYQVFGKCIYGLNDKNEFQQAIIIPEAIFIRFLSYRILEEQGDEYQYASFIVFHEMGHVIANLD